LKFGGRNLLRRWRRRGSAHRFLVRVRVRDRDRARVRARARVIVRFHDGFHE